MEPIQTEFFECRCHSDEHLVVFHYDPDEGDFYLEVHLSNNSFYQRIWQAIKHIFGYKCKYGCFDCWTLDENDAERLMNLLKKKIKFEEDLKLSCKGKN